MDNGAIKNQNFVFPLLSGLCSNFTPLYDVIVDQINNIIKINNRPLNNIPVSVSPLKKLIPYSKEPYILKRTLYKDTGTREYR